MDLTRLRKPSLLLKFGVISLIPLVLLGLILGKSLNGVIQQRSLVDAEHQAEVIARVGLGDSLTRDAVRGGLTRGERRRLDRALQPILDDNDIARLKIWNAQGTVIYSDDRRLIGTTGEVDELKSVLRGEVSSHVSDSHESDSPRDRKLGRVVEVYVPLQVKGDKRPVGALEIYLPYEPIASATASDTRKLYLILLGGLTILYASLFRIVAGASDRLRKQAAEKTHQAMHDGLTGLPNRALFRELVEQGLLAGKRRRGLVGVILMDLDRFKEINDTLGHFNGDLLLQRVGSRLRGVMRDADTIARIGGDEFAILLPELPDTEAASAAAERVLKALEEPFVVGGLALEVEASLGIALYPDNGKRVDGLLQAADVAMYAAKDAHSGYEFYSPEQHHYSPARLALVGELRRAIDENELILHYQPKAELATGAVKGVEALARWEHPQRGLLRPDEFIPLAEHTSLIRPVTLHLLDTALRQVRAWREDGFELTVAVNLSMQNLLDLQLPDDIAKMLDRWSVYPVSLELEITESTIMSEPRRARAVLDRLHNMGVSISVDDFGTGYSSLAYLKQLPVSTIKIDKSFVMGMSDDDDDAVIVQSTIELGRNLGLQVVAEGVETPADWSRLAELRCDYAQGYYLSRPLDPVAFGRWMAAYNEMFVAPAGATGGNGAGATPARVGF